MLASRRGLSLLEVLMVVTLITVMMVLSLPMISRANAKARCELCQQNLAEIGQTIASYTNDMNHMPTLTNDGPGQQGKTLSSFIEERLHSTHVLFCPSDHTESRQSLYTSYRWSPSFNGLKPGQLHDTIGRVMLADRAAYHPGPHNFSNELLLKKSEISYEFTLRSRPESPGQRCPDMPCESIEPHQDAGWDH
ncbi:MAG: type II secretion system protein [Planctomycetota bacterium]